VLAGVVPARGTPRVGQTGFVTPASPFWDALGQASPLAWVMGVMVALDGSCRRTDKD